MKLSEEQKNSLKESAEMAALNKMLDAIVNAAHIEVENFVNSENGTEEEGMKNVLKQIREVRSELGTNNLRLLDSNACPTGQHWDPVLGDCVKD